MRPVTVQVKPEAKDIFAFKIYHSFCSFLGMVRILISFGFIVTAILSIGKFEVLLTAVLFAFGLLNPVVTPIMFWMQAKSTEKQCIPTIYTFTRDKIHMSDGKKKADVRWEDLALTVWLKRELFLYTTPDKAFVLPKHQIGAETEVLLKCIQESAPPGRTVIRKHL